MATSAISRSEIIKPYSPTYLTQYFEHTPNNKVVTYYYDANNGNAVNVIGWPNTDYTYYPIIRVSNYNSSVGSIEIMAVSTTGAPKVMSGYYINGNIAWAL